MNRARVHEQNGKGPLSKIELKHSYIYDFGPRQCLAMPASSDKSADALT